MDFYRIKQRRGKHGTVDVYPDFIVCRPEYASGVLEALWGPRR